MRPFRSFLILLILIVCLTGLCFVFPDIGIFPALKEFFPYLPSSGVTGKQATEKSIADESISDTLLFQKVDTTVLADTLIKVAGENKFDPLSPFIDSLQSFKGQVRIMYYGDSQVEGDRITFYLRQLLREGRGGTGPGLFLPVMPVMYTKSVWLRSSSNWIRYNYLSFNSGEISHHNLGPFMTICRYLPEGVTAPAAKKAFVRIKPSASADSLVSQYDVLRILYSLSRGKVSIRVKADGEAVMTDSLRCGIGVMEQVCSLHGAQDVLIEFEGNVSPDIYGLSIESRSGIILDNIPQRGSAGLEFSMVSRDNLKEAFRLLSPDLIILHYGLNIVRNVRNDYSYYKKAIYRQLTTLRDVAPLTPVLVIGVTDMALNEGDSIKSYSNIPTIIRAQKEAAKDAGAAFWDSYSAMGGTLSIVRWAEKRPPLAQSDYVHFTYPGADTLSLMLNKALFLSRVADTIPALIQAVKPDSTALTSGISGNDKQEEIRQKSVTERIISGIFSYDPDKPFIFSTPAFWLFMLFVLAGYSIVYRKLFLRNIYLLIVSLFFYFKTGGLFLFLLVFVTIIDYTCGFLIFRSQKKVFRRLFILLSLLSNLGILAYFKYTGFLVNTINDIAGSHFQVHDFLASFSNMHLGTSFDISNIILPAGISFFTFQSLSYTFDIYRGKLEPVKNIFDFGFYVSFFPQLVAGPIVRASEFIPQLYSKFSLTKREFSHSLFMISKGLIKKIVISDFIAVNFIDRVFDLPSVYSGFENLMAVYGYGLQIYCDFSGYTDIAIGLALIMGFRLPVNFNSPYKAAGISDFWRRWHISLSRWLKDYLYISLGGNRKGKFRTGINLIITMLLGGLWHGAAIRFVIWGGLHGIGLVFNKIWNSLFGDRLKSKRAGRIIAIFITFNFVNFCWIFFRAPDMPSAILMIRQIFENFAPGSYLTVIPAYSSVFLLIAAGYLIHFLPEKVKESYRGLFIKIPLAVQLAAVMLVAILLFQMRSTDILPFIYFRF